MVNKYIEISNYHQKTLELVKKNKIGIIYNSDHFILIHNNKRYYVNYDDLDFSKTVFGGVYGYTKMFIRGMKLNKLLS